MVSRRSSACSNGVSASPPLAAARQRARPLAQTVARLDRGEPRAGRLEAGAHAAHQALEQIVDPLLPVAERVALAAEAVLLDQLAQPPPPPVDAMPERPGAARAEDVDAVADFTVIAHRDLRGVGARRRAHVGGEVGE